MAVLAAHAASAVMGIPLLKPQHGPAFLGFVDLLPLHGLVKIHQMAVKFRTVHAGKLHFIAYGRRQAPHMPVPSTIMGFMLTMVGMASSLVRRHTNFIMIMGPMATHTS